METPEGPTFIKLEEREITNSLAPPAINRKLEHNMTWTAFVIGLIIGSAMIIVAVGACVIVVRDRKVDL